ncbi:sugar ABC transporter permease [Cohnella endophytica]|uniref:Sugar ABC transporter permease n=1 Tax=Cohnella endophytica TaxID=2419778 RepID=A0A494Y0K8_9BACL|nr:sugar ABC transporter permease [Cohnella endophytica]RKP56297.1 sugar ABC transporter permease [Cohnella endophytica]
MGKRSILFALPAFIIYSALLIVPILLAFMLSFTSWTGYAANPIHYVGIANFIDLWKDEKFLHSIWVTLRLVLVVTLGSNALGLIFALLLNKSGKLTNVFRSVFFVPFVFSTVAVSFIWSSIISYTGVINYLLGVVGLETWQTDFIGNANHAIWSISIIEIWKTVGFNMVIYLAALQTVPAELYEACTIDGGNARNKFRHVTLPMIVPGISISVLMSVINEMKQFDLVKVITDGGPGSGTETIAYHIISQAFGYNLLGYSSAIALVLFVAVVLVSIAHLSITRRFEVES